MYSNKIIEVLCSHKLCLIIFINVSMDNYMYAATNIIYCEKLHRYFLILNLKTRILFVNLNICFQV